MELADIIIGLANRIKDLERRDRASKRTGKVVEVDPAKGLARIELLAKGSNGKPFLSPWVPWAEQAAGLAKTHFPPSVGQQVTLSSETGDLADGVIEQSIPSNQNPRPSKAGDEFVLIDNGGVRVSVSGGKLTITCTDFKVGATQTTLDSKLQVNGESLRHNAKEVGDTHLHGGVVPGGSDTDVPV
ncbi:phage baseplate assembly protein V [Mesorhizobium sp. M0152]|uniref:phage baseplate assembly protein V n=1 Tax=Mesorhizobium sp. M0152 TaxID=2956898 RepID=UPI00333C7FD5